MADEKVEVDKTKVVVDKRIRFSLPETFVLGLLIAASVASGKAIMDVNTLKTKITEPVVMLASMSKKIDNLDSKFDRKIDKIYQLLLRRAESGK